MKKLFVSVPMRGRTEDEIKASIQKMKKIAEIYDGEELELIDTYIENPQDVENQPLWCLGESIKRMADADIFMGINETWDWNGCWIETLAAIEYKIKIYTVSASYIIDGYSDLVKSSISEETKKTALLGRALVRNN